MVAQLVVLVIGQGLARGHHDGLAGVDAHRVEVLHVADRGAVVVGVTHHFVLDLLPAGETLLDQHLGGVGEGRGGALFERLAILADAGAETAERVGDAQHHRVADGFGRLREPRRRR